MRPAVALAALLLLATSGCLGRNAASGLVSEPEFSPEGQSKCSVRASQDKPLIVEWASADRAELEARAKTQVVVVRYDGCEIQLLPHCSAPGAYAYTSVTPKSDTVSIKTVDELYAQVPVGAARLEGKLATSGQLTVEMTMVGRLDTDRPIVAADELDGRCNGATHVLTGMTVGAFEFYAGAGAEIGAGVSVANAGAGAKSTAHKETLTRDGSPAACSEAQGEPHAECSALLRIEVVPLGRPRTRTAACPDGSEWDGERCLRTEVVTETVCPDGATFDGTRCVAPVAASAPATTPGQPAGAAALWNDEHTGEGWYCFVGKSGGKRFGLCDRDRIECGMAMANRKKAGTFTSDSQRCDKQGSASCFQVRRAQDAAPRPFCFPDPALCTSNHAMLDGKKDIAMLTDCLAHK